MKLFAKRIACLLLAACLAVGLLPVSALAARAQDEIAEVPAGEEAFAGLAEQPADPMDARTGDQDPELTISGYTRVTELPADGLSGKYLIVAPYNGNYYMLYPGTTSAGAGKNNSARLVVEDDGAATGYQVGSGTTYDSAEEKTGFSAADNTVTQNASNYSITAVGPDSTAYYLFNSSNPIYSTSSPSALTIESSSNSGYFRLRNTASNRAHLAFYVPHMNYNQSGGLTANTADCIIDLMLFRKDVLPGYNQVTKVSQIKADRKYLIVAEAPNGTFYALHINADGASNRPGATAYPNCAATLSVSDGAVTAVSTANTETAIAMSDLLVTISPSDTNYTIKNATYCLALTQNEMYHAASEDIPLEISFVVNGRCNIHNSTANRYVTFNVNGDTATSHYPQSPTGFCGWGDPQPNYIPIYLYIEGDLPVEPGSALAGMLSGDQIGGANGSADPAGQNSWVFTGGRAAQGSFVDVAGARTWAGHFEEWVRYTQTKSLQTGGEADSPYLQRHVINAAYEEQTLAQIVSTFDDRIGALKPRAVVYLVDENGSSVENFATNLNGLIDKALALKDGTGMLVIATLTQADKTAVDAVVDALTDARKPRVLPVLVTLTDAQKAGGYPNAQGHLALAKALADAVAGSPVSNTEQWPYGISGLSSSTFTANWPVKATVTANHEGYGVPESRTAPQATIKSKVDNTNTAMTWLFMGDSITHGSAWTGGYDSLAQLFEKFVKDDLGRTQDIVINAGSSGANTASTITDLDRRLTKYNPDVVVLMLGTNTSGVSDDQYQANIRTILDAIITKGAVPVLRTPPPSTNSGYTSRLATRSQLIRDVAAETAYANKVILVDQYETWTNSNWQEVFARNNLHPDEAGHLWFAHQLINEMGLWKADSAICQLEYVAREEAEPVTAPVVPGYTQLTDMADVDQTKGYLIVSRDAEGNLYALYPSALGETLGAGALPSSPTAEDNGARAAALTVNGQNVTAKWLKNDAALEMNTLLFGIKASDGGYVFTAANGRHLNMADYMFTEGTVALEVTNRGADRFNAFQIRNSSADRYLDFSKNGDPNAFQGSSAGWGTDFWAPRSMSMNVWLFEGPDLPTAKSMLQDLLTTATGLTAADYTRASWNALQTAKAAAQQVLTNNPDADPDAQAFADARDALRDAIDGLQTTVTVPTVPEGATKIEDWKTMVPANGTTQNEPFASGTGGSDKFRIPAIITLKHQTGANAGKNGRLLAAIDARWNHTGDACALDTIVSYSDNNGGDWNYHFANYFGDSTNAKDAHASTIIDPQLTEGKDGTIYLMVDIYPGGVGLNTAPAAPEVSTGFAEIDGIKRMMLYTSTSGQTDDNYSYYVGAFTNGYAPVMEPLGGEADVFSGFYVDEYYYLYHTAGEFNAKTPANDKIYCQRLGDNTYVQQNVFFYNATLHARIATFLCIAKSTDGGETWSAPQIINDQVHQGDYRFYGVGPGAGLCVDTAGSTNPNAIPDGTLILPIYNNTGETARFIYSTDNGTSWHMGKTATELGTGWSSESCLVQIDDTTVRQFYRDGWYNSGVVRYTDHTWNGTGWDTGDVVRVESATRWGACQVSAIKYSQKINGKDLILYSAPASTSGRAKGVIHALLVNEDKTLTLFNTYTVDGDKDYKYSSLTETKDGDIALLYEGPYDNAKGDVSVFKIIPIESIVPTAKDPTSVSLTQSAVTPNEDGSITLYTNTAETDGRKHTVQLNAAVLPSMADQTVTWKSSDEDVATVSGTGLVTAKGNGTATITATSTKRGVFATLTVKVDTQIERITVKKDGTDIGSGPVKVYTNAEDAGHSVILTADTDPANVTHPALNWTRPDGAKGQLTLSDRGLNGSSITITAVPGERNVGEVNVRVASADHPEVYKEFKVHVIRKLESTVSISIVGVNDPAKAPQFGQTLEADINNLQMTDAGKAALTYQWKRTKGGTTTNIGTGAKTYTLTQADIGAVISVDVTAGANSFYEGTRSATRALPVELADGPLTGPQDLTGTAPTAADASDGSISGFGTDYAAYEYRLMVTDGVENEWADVTAATIENLAAGTYQVRAKETATHKAGGVSVVTVPAFGATTYAIALDAMTNGRVSRSASVAEENTPVTLTVLPETGYRLEANGLRVEKSDGSPVTVTRVAGRDNEYTFTMPGEAVTVKAAFEQLTFTVTHELTNLHCSRGAADGHQVAYGESTAVTLIPNEGYVLPLRKDITIRNSLGDQITGWTISDDGVITITGGVTSDLIIIAVGRPDTHTVNYTLTNGLKKSAETADSVGHMAAYTGALVAEEGYALPETIIVTVGGSLIGEGNYLYNKDTGEISISAGKIYDNVVITAVGVKTGDEIVSVTGVTLNQTQASMTVGGTLSLVATVAPADATNKAVVWSAADPGIAAVDENGVVTGVAEGTTTITVMTVNGRQTAECVVTVTEATAPSRPSGGNNGSTTTQTETREDGSKVTTVTKPDGTVTETVEQPDGSNSETVTTKDGAVTITVTDAEGEELAKVELPATIPAPETRFDDVPEDHWADKAIHNAAALELVKGVGNNKFDMVAPMSRGSLATVLHRLSQGKTDYETTFQDVAQGKFYTEGVAWAAKVKVVTGYTEDIFAPEDVITREQLAVMLARYAKLIGMDTKADAKALDQFADGENTGSWAVNGVAWCVENGILQGKGGNVLDPTTNVTRAEVAVMLDRFIALMK